MTTSRELELEDILRKLLNFDEHGTVASIFSLIEKSIGGISWISGQQPQCVQGVFKQNKRNEDGP